MAYNHGVYVSEVPTSIIPAVNSNAGLPVVFGTAPVHLTSNPAVANKPILCYSYSEAVAAFGYSDNWTEYTLCEAIYSQFALFAVSPIVFVNVLDINTHKTAVAGSSKNIIDGVVKIAEPVILGSLKVKLTQESQDLVKGVDYEALYNDEEVVVITPLSGGQITVGQTSLYISYDKVNPSAVSADDIIGGIDISTGAVEGLEALNKVFPLYGLVPGMVLAPGWTQNPEIAAVMNAKAGNINGHFKAISLVDIPTDVVKKYTDVSAWKSNNNYIGNNMAVCWPKVKLGSKTYHLSTQLMGVMGQVDVSNDNVPYESPSNKALQANGSCLADGSEVTLGPDQATYLNSQGIITALNFIGGWKLWGNRTGCYPANTDPKDAFLCIRRMNNWQAQTFIQTYWSKTDKPMTKRLIDTVVDSENIRLNGLAARGFILGGRIEFLKSENPTTDLLDGIIRFHTYWTPPTPAREIVNAIEYDPSYFSTLFN